MEISTLEKNCLLLPKSSDFTTYNFYGEKNILLQALKVIIIGQHCLLMVRSLFTSYVKLEILVSFLNMCKTLKWSLPMRILPYFDNRVGEGDTVLIRHTGKTRSWGFCSPSDVPSTSPRILSLISSQIQLLKIFKLQPALTYPYVKLVLVLTC